LNKSAIISSKGQVVIPKQIRELYSLSQNTRVVFEPAGEAVIMRPAKEVGSAKLEKKLSEFEIDEDFRKGWEVDLANKIKKWQW